MRTGISIFGSRKRMPNGNTFANTEAEMRARAKHTATGHADVKVNNLLNESRFSGGTIRIIPQSHVWTLEWSPNIIVTIIAGFLRFQICYILLYTTLRNF